LTFEVVSSAAVDERFWKEHEREALSALYGFRVVWHEQRHEFRAVDARSRTIGAIHCVIAASIATIERLVVAPPERRRGVGRALLERVAETANYYNCHKVSVPVPHKSEAQRFLEACGYRVEAVLPQHTFKLDVAMMRKFLL
jgi:GNAT superfamily N-acetyltransferase